MVKSGRSVAEVSRTMGIGENLLYKWRSEENGQEKPVELEINTEIEHLRKQLKQAETERAKVKATEHLPVSSSPYLPSDDELQYAARLEGFVSDDLNTARALTLLEVVIANQTLPDCLKISVLLEFERVFSIVRSLKRGNHVRALSPQLGCAGLQLVKDSHHH